MSIRGTTALTDQIGSVISVCPTGYSIIVIRQALTANMGTTQINSNVLSTRPE